MATLLYIITEGIQDGPFELSEGTHVIGSAEGSAILIPDSTISAQHGQFTVTDGQIVYQDLGSQNGSFVSEQPVTQPVALIPGHILQAGNIHLQLVDNPEVVESVKRETAVISNTPKAIEPSDFGSVGPGVSAFEAKSSKWVKTYVIVAIVIGALLGGLLVYMLIM